MNINTKKEFMYELERYVDACRRVNASKNGSLNSF